MLAAAAIQCHWDTAHAEIRKPINQKTSPIGSIVPPKPLSLKPGQIKKWSLLREFSAESRCHCYSPLTVR